MSTKITIAQALRRVKKLKGQIAEHTQRAQQSVSYVKGNVPAFRFDSEVASLRAAQIEMLDLQSRIAVANAKATVSFGNDTITHAEAIRRLQEMKGDIAFLKSLVIRNETVKTRDQEYDATSGRYVPITTETTFVSDLSEKDRDKQVRDLQDGFEALNNAVEDHNHKVTI